MRRWLTIVERVALRVGIVAATAFLGCGESEQRASDPAIPAERAAKQALQRWLDATADGDAREACSLMTRREKDVSLYSIAELGYPMSAPSCRKALFQDPARGLRARAGPVGVNGDMALGVTSARFGAIVVLKFVDGDWLVHRAASGPTITVNLHGLLGRPDPTEEAVQDLHLTMRRYERRHVRLKGLDIAGDVAVAYSKRSLADGVVFARRDEGWVAIRRVSAVP